MGQGQRRCHCYVSAFPGPIDYFLSYKNLYQGLARASSTSKNTLLSEIFVRIATLLIIHQLAIHVVFAADLTPEEVAAIDIAGAQGPPSKFIFTNILRLWQAVSSRSIIVCFFLAVVYFLGFALVVKGLFAGEPL